MNVLLIGSKSDCNSYTEILKKAPDTTVLGAVTLINDKTIKELKGKYNPHTILFDSGVPHKRMDISVCLSAICSEFPKSTVVVMCEPEESEIFKNLGVYAVISTTITNVQLCDILKSAASEYGKNSAIANMIDEVDELTIKDRCDIKKGFSTQITLSYRSKTLEIADSFTLTATVTPKNKKVKWTTSDEKIAKIKSTGYVKAVSIGTATITATVDGQSASCTVRVIDRQ